MPREPEGARAGDQKVHFGVAMKIKKTQRAKIDAALQMYREAVEQAADAVSQYQAACDEARAELDAALERFNSTRADAWCELETHVSAVGDARTELAEAVQSVGADLREAFDGHSERWQESDAGQATDEWVRSFEDYEPTNTWEPDEPCDVSVDDLDECEVPTEPSDPFDDELSEELV